MVHVYETWKENVGVYTDCLAIRWKASQKKDRRHIRSENSEDALTWQTFRSLEAAELLDRFAADMLGLTDHYIAYYWQRPHDQYDIDPTVDRVLAEVEPYHRQHGCQHTETDLILRGERTLIVAEIKLGYKKRRITGWCQAKNSPIVDDYEPHARQFVTDVAHWKQTVARFAQLYKNLFVGRRLSELWSATGQPLELHLLAVVNGATQEKKSDGSIWTYRDEFEAFQQSTTFPQDALHLLEWQQIRDWILAQRATELGFVQDRLKCHSLS
jgi:hypothetical protein